MIVAEGVFSNGTAAFKCNSIFLPIKKAVSFGYRLLLLYFKGNTQFYRICDLIRVYESFYFNGSIMSTCAFVVIFIFHLTF